MSSINLKKKRKEKKRKESQRAEWVRESLVTNFSMLNLRRWGIGQGYLLERQGRLGRVLGSFYPFIIFDLTPFRPFSYKEIMANFQLNLQDFSKRGFSRVAGNFPLCVFTCEIRLHSHCLPSRLSTAKWPHLARPFPTIIHQELS